MFPRLTPSVSENMDDTVTCTWCLKVVKKASFKRHRKGAKKCLITGSLLSNKRTACPSKNSRCVHSTSNLKALPSILKCKHCYGALEKIKDTDKQYRDFRSVKAWVNWLTSPVPYLPRIKYGILKYRKTNSRYGLNRRAIHSSFDCGEDTLIPDLSRVKIEGQNLHKSSPMNSNCPASLHCKSEEGNLIPNLNLVKIEGQNQHRSSSINSRDNMNRDKQSSSSRDPRVKLNTSRIGEQFPRHITDSTDCNTIKHNNSIPGHHDRVPRGRSGIRTSSGNQNKHSQPRISYSRPMAIRRHNSIPMGGRSYDHSRFVGNPRSHQAHFNNRNEDDPRTNAVNNAQTPLAPNDTESVHTRDPRSQLHPTDKSNCNDDQCTPRRWSYDESWPVDLPGLNQGHRRFAIYRSRLPGRGSFIHHSHLAYHQMPHQAHFENTSYGEDYTRTIHINRFIPLTHENERSLHQNSRIGVDIMNSNIQIQPYFTSPNSFSQSRLNDLFCGVQDYHSTSHEHRQTAVDALQITVTNNYYN